MGILKKVKEMAQNLWKLLVFLDNLSQFCDVVTH